MTCVEEDHGAPGGFLMMGDEIVVAASALFGEDGPDALAAICHGSAVITWMPKGDGEVFCGGSTEWPWALACAEPMVERVVRNVLTRFAA